MRGTKTFQPRLELAPPELHDLMALATREVVVVAGAAEPIARLTRAVHEHVDDAVLAQQGKRAVHGCEPDGVPAALSDSKIS